MRRGRGASSLAGTRQRLLTCLLYFGVLELALVYCMELLDLFLLSGDELVFKAAKRFLSLLFHVGTKLIRVGGVNHEKANALRLHLQP